MHERQHMIYSVHLVLFSFAMRYTKLFRSRKMPVMTGPAHQRLTPSTIDAMTERHSFTQCFLLFGCFFLI